MSWLAVGFHGQHGCPAPPQMPHDPFAWQVPSSTPQEEPASTQIPSRIPVQQPPGQFLTEQQGAPGNPQLTQRDEKELQIVPGSAQVFSAPGLQQGWFRAPQPLHRPATHVPRSRQLPPSATQVPSTLQWLPLQRSSAQAGSPGSPHFAQVQEPDGLARTTEPRPQLHPCKSAQHLSPGRPQESQEPLLQVPRPLSQVVPGARQM